MNEEIKKLENCLKAMKKCLKIPNVENCICFSDAFKVLKLEVNELNKNPGQTSDLKNKGRLIKIKEEIEKIHGVISKGKKECIGCTPCIAGVVFKSYPDRLDSLYLNNKL